MRRQRKFFDFIPEVLAGAIFVAVLLGVFMLERAKWRECRRYHPMWYCVVSGGK